MFRDQSDIPLETYLLQSGFHFFFSDILDDGFIVIWNFLPSEKVFVIRNNSNKNMIIS